MLALTMLLREADGGWRDWARLGGGGCSSLVWLEVEAFDPTVRFRVRILSVPETPPLADRVDGRGGVLVLLE